MARQAVLYGLNIAGFQLRLDPAIIQSTGGGDHLLRIDGDGKAGNLRHRLRCLLQCRNGFIVPDWNNGSHSFITCGVMINI